MRVSWLWMIAGVVGTLGFGACARPDTVKHAGVTLADAYAMVEPPAGPEVVIPVGGQEPKLPVGAKVVRIVADRDAPYASVRNLVLQVRKAGAEPVLIVGRNGKLGALPHGADAISDSILLDAEDDGKACVSPPEAEERLCAQPPYGKHVDRASVRGLVRDAVKGYKLDHVHVRPSLGLSWVDAVRAIDGARTCGAPGVVIQVSVEGVAL